MEILNYDLILVLRDLQRQVTKDQCCFTSVWVLFSNSSIV